MTNRTETPTPRDDSIACAIVGPGNIGTDLAKKIMRSSKLKAVAMVGVDPGSDGLRRAKDWGMETSAGGAAWLVVNAERLGVKIVFDATSAKAHIVNAPLYEAAGLVAIDLTPASIGPAVVPAVNLTEHLRANNINMITCGAQATIPMVAAVSRVTAVPYAEIISSMSSRSAGPGTRANIDESTETTARGLVTIGGAAHGKAIIVLNPAEPAVLMRNTVFCGLPERADRVAIEASIEEMVVEVAKSVPGYRCKGIVFDEGPFGTPGGIAQSRVSVLLEVTGNGDDLTVFAGNFDIMTCSAMRVAETIAAERFAAEPTQRIGS